MTSSRERSLLIAALVLVLAAPGCMMVVDSPEVQGSLAAVAGSPEAAPVALALATSVVQDGVHLEREEEWLETPLHGFLLEGSLRRAGLLKERVPAPTPASLNLLVDVEEERHGPVGLRVVSSVTLGIVPAWTSVRYTVRAQGTFRGQAIQPFRFEQRATRVDELLLFPVAPFWLPARARMDMRRDAVEALVHHLGAEMTRIAAAGKEEQP